MSPPLQVGQGQGSSDRSAEVCVVGAGAAGLWAAAVAARRGLDVLVLEKTARTGTKVLASGGTHCNLTTTLGPDAAAKLFGPRGERFLRTALRTLPPARVRERFHELGVPTVEAPLEKIFPASGRARDVRDALERWARGAGARILLSSPVTGVEPAADGWVVRVSGGAPVRCRSLLLCPGGASYPRTGTTGDGYAWLAELDLPVVPPVPALAPLRSPAAWVQALTGLAWQSGELRLVDGGGRVVGKRRRPVLFTHEGLSGPAAMDLSGHVARAVSTDAHGGVPFEARLDFFPDVDREALRAALVAAAAQPGRLRLSRGLPLPVPRRLLEAVCEQAGLGTSEPLLSELSKARRHAVVETLKGLPVPIDGTAGYDRAEVTAGGLDLRAVDPRTMAVNGRPGLHVFGELLDLDGPIGGLNFQAAFACAELAGLALAPGA